MNELQDSPDHHQLKVFLERLIVQKTANCFLERKKRIPYEIHLIRDFQAPIAPKTNQPNGFRFQVKGKTIKVKMSSAQLGLQRRR